MHSYREQSQLLVGPALDRLRRGDPEVVAFLYQHYTYLHPDVQLLVFKAIWERLRSTQDQALAKRLRDHGVGDLGADFPQLAWTIRKWSDRVWTGAARELVRPTFADIYARSPRAAALRHIVVSLPLSATLGAKLRLGTKALTARWPAVSASIDVLIAWVSTPPMRLRRSPRDVPRRRKPSGGQLRSRRAR